VELLLKELETKPEISEEEISRLVRVALEGDAEAFGSIFEMLSS